MGHRHRHTIERSAGGTTAGMLALASVMILTRPAAAQLFDRPGKPVSAETLVVVQAQPTRSVIGAGETQDVAIRFDVAEGWHVYWKNPGEGAAPIEIELRLPDGFESGPVRWPRPLRLPSPLGDVYCYEGQVTLFASMTAPPTLSDGEHDISASVVWAVCNDDRCLLGRVSRSMKITTLSAPRGGAATAEPPGFAAARARLPRQLPGEDAITLDGDVLRVTGPAHGLGEATFFPNGAPGVAYGEPAIDIHGDRFEMQIDVAVNENNTLGLEPALGGVIALGPDVMDPSYEFEQPLAVLRRK